jgi:hypothetical protein
MCRQKYQPITGKSTIAAGKLSKLWDFEKNVFFIKVSITNISSKFRFVELFFTNM